MIDEAVLTVPMLIVPAVWVAVPTSMVRLPELEVVPVALPDWMVMALLLVEAVDVLLELTLLAEPALKAYGTPVSLVRLLFGASISESAGVQAAKAQAEVPLTVIVSHSSWSQLIVLGKAVTEARLTEK